MKLLYCSVFVLIAVVKVSSSDPEFETVGLASRKGGRGYWDRDWEDTDSEYNDIYRDRPECPENEYSYGLKTHAFYRPHRRCYEIGSKGPCNTNMRFYLESEGSKFGDCDCDATVGYGCGRPLVYSKKNDWCYPVHAQGPCKPRFWVTLDAAGMPSCQPNPCEREQRYDYSDESDCEYWVSYKGKCVKTMSQGPCLNGEVFFWDASDETKTAPRCTNSRYLDRLLSSDIGTLGVALGTQCLPGQKHTILGKCGVVRTPAQSPFAIEASKPPAPQVAPPPPPPAGPKIIGL